MRIRTLNTIAGYLEALLNADYVLISAILGLALIVLGVFK